MEQTCLKHLDRAGSWEYLNKTRPEETDLIGWRQVSKIFRFNLVLFAAIFAVLLSLLAFGSGYSRADSLEDLPIGLLLTLLISVGMATYVADLYRRSWNHRARYLNEQQ